MESRLSSWLRANAVDLALAFLVLLFGFVFVRLGVLAEKASPEQSLYIGLAVLAAGGAGTLAVRLLRPPEGGSGEIRAERIKATQRLLEDVRNVREAVLFAWHNRHLLEPDGRGGFVPGSVAERRTVLAQTLALRNQAFNEDVWIGEDGVIAVRRFIAGIDALDIRGLQTEEDVRSAVNALMEQLRAQLLR